MRLANDQIVIGLPGARLRLKCSLRAAARLLAKYDGPEQLVSYIHACTVTACLDVIRECADDSNTLALVTVRMSEKGLADTLWPMREELIVFVLRLFGASESNRTSGEPSKPITYDEMIQRLFGVATGWLGWQPSEAWSASIAEILTARDALIEKLKAIHGSADQNEETIDASEGGLSPSLAAELNALGDLYVTSMPRKGA